MRARPSLAGHRRLLHLIGLALCLAAGAILSLRSGQDANWDLLDYHLYNGAAFLHGRFERDLLPTGLQSDLNPLLDALYAGLALGPLKAAPRVLAAATGLWFGTWLFLSARLSLLLYADRGLALAAFALSVTGAATVSEIGTTTEDLQTGVVMLAGLLVLLNGTSLPRTAAGGLLFGLAAALKLTSATYAPAALLMAVTLHHRASRSHVLRAGILFSCGWLGGFAAADGWWAATLSVRFGSPTFPMFNGVFRSALYPPVSFTDGRFLPHGAAQWVFYPLFWAFHPAARVSEFPLRDPRLAVALCLLPLALRPPRGAPARAMLVFLAIGYLAWLTTSSILRYAVILENVAGLMTPMLLARLAAPSTRAGTLLVALATTVILCDTRYPATRRVAFGPTVLAANAGSLPANTLLVLTFRAPVSYLVPLFRDSRGLQVVDVGSTVLEARGYGLYDRVTRLVRTHAGPIRVLSAGYPYYPELGEVGLSPKVTDCRSIESNDGAAGAPPANLCTGALGPPLVLHDPFWARAARRYGTLVQIGSSAQRLIGAAYLAAAGPASRGTHLVDWSDLLWSGVGSVHDRLPDRLDPDALYVLPPASLAAAARRAVVGRDLLAAIDGFVVLAPGWYAAPRRGRDDRR